MKKVDIKEILERVDAGEATEQEMEIAKLWLFQLRNQDEVQIPQSKLDLVNTKNWARLQVNLEQGRVKIKLWPRIAIAAAVMIFILSIGFYFYGNHDLPKQSSVIVNDVDPGKQVATLTLASGKKIRLSEVQNGEIAKEAGMRITKTANGQLIYEIKKGTGESGKTNTLSTARGETYMILLPDGTKVWLNSASSLTYLTNIYETKTRNVKLDGEAYFEVFKNHNHPFVVQTDKQEVEVLGTHFNINSYSDEGTTATTLIEGSVKVSIGNLKQILKPGQQALNTGSTLKVTEPDIESITDWKEGDFYLDNINFKTAMRKIARWYNVEVIYDPSVSDRIKLGGWISRNKNLSAVLKLIESSSQVSFKIEGRKIYVSGKS